MSEPAKKDLTEQFSESTDTAWNQGTLDVLDDMFAKDVVVHNVPVGVDYEGLDAFKEWISDVRKAFPDFTVDYSDADFIVGDTKVASQWVASGTFEGQLPDIDAEPTGKSATFEGVTVYELDGEKVTEAWWYWDTLDFLVQLGIIPEEMAP